MKQKKISIISFGITEMLILRINYNTITSKIKYLLQSKKTTQFECA